MMQKIIPHLWYDSEAEEAANFYVSVFSENPLGLAQGESKIDEVARYQKVAEEVSGKKEGSVMTVSFSLNGQNFIALNGGPDFKFNESISFVINCENQEEVDYFWEKLSEGGDPKAQICGWLKDKYGLSWQVVPTVLGEMLSGGDPEKSERAMGALLKMGKIDIAKLKEAYEGK